MTIDGLHIIYYFEGHIEGKIRIINVLKYTTDKF
jgi:hypothetical protein